MKTGSALTEIPRFVQVLRSGLFDERHYLATGPDLRGPWRVLPALHYSLHGWKEERTPNPLFAPDFYLREAPADALNEIPILHYRLRGERDGHHPHPEFDPEWYRRHAGIQPEECALAHYLRIGRRKGLAANSGILGLQAKVGNAIGIDWAIQHVFAKRNWIAAAATDDDLERIMRAPSRGLSIQPKSDLLPLLLLLTRSRGSSNRLNPLQNALTRMTGLAWQWIHSEGADSWTLTASDLPGRAKLLSSAEFEAQRLSLEADPAPRLIIAADLDEGSDYDFHHSLRTILFCRHTLAATAELIRNSPSTIFLVSAPLKVESKSISSSLAGTSTSKTRVASFVLGSRPEKLWMFAGADGVESLPNDLAFLETPRAHIGWETHLRGHEIELDARVPVIPDSSDDFRVAVVSCSIGPYRQCHPLRKQAVRLEARFHASHGFDPDLGWKFIPVQIDGANDPTRASRAIKTTIQASLAGFDYFVWIDSSVQYRGDLRDAIRTLNSTGAQFGYIPHPHRRTVLLEANACERLGKDSAELIQAQMNHYRETDPGCLAERPIESGFFIADLRAPATRRFFEIWSGEITRWSRRDQLSFNYSARAAGLKTVPLMETPLSTRSHSDFILFAHQRR